MIEYGFFLEGDRTIRFTVDRGRRHDLREDARPHADWTRLEFQPCDNCPHRASGWRHCPAALDLEQITSQFSDILSFERAKVEVITPERAYVRDCDVQTALRSLLGLVMATSACAILAQFRGLAASHLPFATLDETLFRTTGSYLLKQYFIQQDGGQPDWQLRGLHAFYRELQTVNRGFKRRLDSAFAKDANLNAIGSLLYVSMGVTYGLEDNLRELRERFCPKG